MHDLRFTATHLCHHGGYQNPLLARPTDPLYPSNYLLMTSKFFHTDERGRAGPTPNVRPAHHRTLTKAGTRNRTKRAAWRMPSFVQTRPPTHSNTQTYVSPRVPAKLPNPITNLARKTESHRPEAQIRNQVQRRLPSEAQNRSQVTEFVQLDSSLYSLCSHAFHASSSTLCKLWVSAVLS